MTSSINNHENSMNIYKPKGKGTLITDLLKKNYTEDNIEDDIEDENNNNDYKGIQKLAKDVNISLQELEKSDNNRKHNIELDNDVNYTQLTENKTDDDNDITIETVEYCNDYVYTFVEILLLLTVYVVMSQPFIVLNVSKYITHLQPVDDGVIRLSGIIIYGLILSLLFIAVRYIILHKPK